LVYETNYNAKKDYVSKTTPIFDKHENNIQYQLDGDPQNNQSVNDEDPTTHKQKQSATQRRWRHINYEQRQHNTKELPADRRLQRNLQIKRRRHEPTTIVEAAKNKDSLSKEKDNSRPETSFPPPTTERTKSINLTQRRSCSRTLEVAGGDDKNRLEEGGRQHGGGSSSHQINLCPCKPLLY